MFILKAHIHGRIKTIDISSVNNGVTRDTWQEGTFLHGNFPGCYFKMVTGEVRSLFSSWTSCWSYYVYLLIWHNVSSDKWYRKLNRMHPFIFLYNHNLLVVKMKLNQRFRTSVFSSSIMACHFQFNAYIIELVHLLLSLIQKIHFPEEKIFLLIFNCLFLCSISVHSSPEVESC